ncbi:MAG: asparagine synthase (glutamine-hydrolyzing) [Desulfobacterales bacterium]|nr:asparagine synthase (glutamine-hydrolyzing) [Desulfobacterales bacterium]
MCGIAGIFRLNNIVDSDIEIVKKINSIQKHRGPDDEGIYSDSSCALGHVRLSIIDISKDGHQPFISDDKRFYLIYNGEIYNYIELREDLKKLGWTFRTKTDTEVLLKAYIQFKENCLSLLNGMFAFVIYDSLNSTLFLARDRVGIKPLYYAFKDSTFYFASEIKSFNAIPEFKKSINNLSLFDYLVFNRTDVYDETFINEIKRIPNGCYASFNGYKLNISKWWNPENYILNCETNLEESKELIHDILVSAVKLRMRSDVPVGSCLSGGLDSSILVGILFQHNQAKEDYKTFTASFPNHYLDETKYIDILNKKYPFKNFRTFPSSQKAYENLKNYVYTNDEPTTSPTFYSQYEVMRLAKEQGVTVLLDGQGGDENFAGYQYFHGFNLFGLIANKKVKKFSYELISSLKRKQHISAYQTLLFQILPDIFKKRLLLKTVPYISPDFFYTYIDKSKIYNEFFNVSGLNQSLVRHFQYKLEHLLRMEDRNSMAFSIEARVPYLDYRLIQYTLGVSEEFKIKVGETKYLQKIALSKYTIPEIVNRRDKIGFGTPGDEWMREDVWHNFSNRNYNELKKELPDIFRKYSSVSEKGLEIWKINQLYVWKKLFLV